MHKNSQDAMYPGEEMKPPPGSRGPWWVAAAGVEALGIVAAVLQDHQLGWVLLMAFIAWLIHNVLIACLSKGSRHNRS
jgi:hypothetical protein